MFYDKNKIFVNNREKNHSTHIIYHINKKKPTLRFMLPYSPTHPYAKMCIHEMLWLQWIFFPRNWIYEICDNGFTTILNGMYIQFGINTLTPTTFPKYPHRSYVQERRKDNHSQILTAYTELPVGSQIFLVAKTLFCFASVLM